MGLALWGPPRTPAPWPHGGGSSGVARSRSQPLVVRAAAKPGTGGGVADGAAPGRRTMVSDFRRAFASAASEEALGELLVKWAPQLAGDAVALERVLDMAGQSRRLPVVDMMAQWVVAKGTEEVRSRCFRAVLAAYSRAGTWREVLTFFEELLPMTAPDSRATVEAITACGLGSRWWRALELLQSAEPPEEAIYAAAIGACGRRSNWAQALWVLDEMSAAAVESQGPAHLEAMRACRTAASTPKVVELLHTMAGQSLEVDKAAFLAAFNSCRSADAWGRALQVFNMMAESGVEVDILGYTSAASISLKQQRWQQTLELLDSMVSRRLLMDTVTYSIYIEACGMGKMVDRAVATLDTMVAERLEVDAIAATTVLVACAEAGDWQKSLQLLESRLRGVKKDGKLFAVLLGACERARAYDAGMRLVETMVNRDVQASPEVYSTAFGFCSAVGGWQRALQMLGILVRRLPPSQAAMASRLRAAAIGGCGSIGGRGRKDPLQGLELFDAMVRASVETDATVARSAIEVCKRTLSWEQAVQLLLALERQGCMSKAAYNQVLWTCRAAGQFDMVLKLCESFSQ